MDDSYEIALQETAEIGYDLEDDTDDEEEEQMAVEISTQSARVDGATSCHTTVIFVPFQIIIYTMFFKSNKLSW